MQLEAWLDTHQLKKESDQTQSTTRVQMNVFRPAFDHTTFWYDPVEVMAALQAGEPPPIRTADSEPARNRFELQGFKRFWPRHLGGDIQAIVALGNAQSRGTQGTSSGCSSTSPRPPPADAKPRIPSKAPRFTESGSTPAEQLVSGMEQAIIIKEPNAPDQVYSPMYRWNKTERSQQNAMSYRSDFAKWMKMYIYIREFLRQDPKDIKTGYGKLRDEAIAWAKNAEVDGAGDANDAWFGKAVAVAKKWIQ